MSYYINEQVEKESFIQSFGFFCPQRMHDSPRRKAFTNLVKGNKYVYLTYLAGYTHGNNALQPYELEFLRSSNYFISSEKIRPKIINDGGTMREHNAELDGYLLNQQCVVEHNDVLYMFFSTWPLTSNPPANALSFSRVGRTTKMVISYDYGDTWSELKDIASRGLTPSTKPLVVGNEIWFTGYGAPNMDNPAVSDIESWLIKIDISDNSVISSHQIDSLMPELNTSEPCLIEVSDNRYMCVMRVNSNNDYPGEELQHKGFVIAYSNDGEIWDEYYYEDQGTSYPNQPKLTKIDDRIYFSHGAQTAMGYYDNMTGKVNFLVYSPASSSWQGIHGSFVTQFAGSNHILSGRIYRYSPISGNETVLETITGKSMGGIDILEVDKDKGIYLACVGFKQDTTGNEMGEPWVSILKTNPVSADYTNSYGRFLFMTGIPGDYHTSNEIAIRNIFVNEGDTIIADWVSSEHRNIGLSYSIVNSTIIFTASEAVSNAKIVYEIIKA